LFYALTARIAKVPEPDAHSKAALDIISWQPVLTDHQSYTLEALKHAAKANLTVYVLKSEDPSRNAQGWINRHSASLSPEILAPAGFLRNIVQVVRRKPGAVHLFGSPFDQAPLIVALMVALAMGAKVFLVSEPYSPIPAGYLDDRNRVANRLKAWLRPFVYGAYGALIRRRIAGVFAISPLAVSQYRRLGIPAGKIFSFGYFIPRLGDVLSKAEKASPELGNGLRVVFVGSLTTRKGLDIAMHAVRTLHAEGVPISLDAYGPGDTSRYEFDETATRYCGTIPFGSAQAVIARYHMLIVPSRFDGWGVVVNEALMVGVPVVCSDRVGAGVLVDAWKCGAIFRSGDIFALKAALHDFVVHPERLARAAEAASKAGSALDPLRAGRFMYDAIRNPELQQPPEFLTGSFLTAGDRWRG
jgi:glycosyltransferase involved in cell wall biosynthesis